MTKRVYVARHSHDRFAIVVSFVNDEGQEEECEQFFLDRDALKRISDACDRALFDVAEQAKATLEALAGPATKKGGLR